MSVLSRFQTLPEFMVKRILDYLLNDPKVNKQIGLSLLHSCSLWRSLFIREASSNMEIILSKKQEVVFNYTRWPKDAIVPEFAKNHLVKSIDFAYDCWIDYDKKYDFELFASYLPCDSKFESAHHLNLHIDINCYINNAYTLGQISDILGHFRKLVPNIKSIVFDCASTQLDERHDFDSFFKYVFYLASDIPTVTIKRTHRRVYYSSVDIDAFTDLTSFTFTCNMDPGAYNQVIRRNASTLKALNAEYYYKGDLYDILFDKGTPIVYPNLEVLDIYFGTEIYNNDITGTYKTGRYYDSQDEADETHTRFICLVMDAAKELRRLDIKGCMDRTYFMRFLDIPHRFAFLRKLKIPGVDLTFSDILILLKTAPLLALLDVALKDACPRIDGVEPRELVSHVETEYANLGRNINRVYLFHPKNNDPTSYCQIIALLVVMCPNLIYLFTRSYDGEEIRERLMRMSETDEYSEYSYNLKM
ncbi:hypothetical protein FB645_005293, partial [Coemansia sp. IMI 203386]